MKEPIVSVCTPVYNTEKYIAEAIESILSQTFTDFEFLICDDCSTDGTLEIIKKYQKKDKRIKLLQNNKNLGIAGNRNRLISESKGKYIVWQDADDISMPFRIEHQVEFMNKNPNVGICGGWLESFTDNKILDVRKYDLDNHSLRKNIFRFSPVAQPTAIIRKECFEKVGNYNLEYPPAEDIDMSFRIGKFYEFANLQEIVISYREHPNSATSKRIGKIIKTTLKVRLENMKSGYYHYNIVDIGALLSSYIVKFFPAQMTIKLFKILRNIIR